MPERREREQPERWPSSLPFRKRPKPYSRAVTWRPGNGAPPDRSRPYELFITQSVLRDVRSHLITARTGEPYGFLLGQVVYCPWTEAPYIIIDALRRETQSIPHGGDVARFRRSWAAASREARRRLGQVIGWYHRHGVLGLRLSEWDLRLQEEFFPEPWHCALVIAPGRGRVLGGFIQRSLRAHLFRKGLAPFYELVELGAKPIDGRRPSLVDWDNYTTGDAVEIVRARWPEPRPSSDASEQGDAGTPEAEGTGSTPTERPERESSIVVPRSRRRWRPTGATGDSDTGPDAGFVAEFARTVELPDGDVPQVGRPTPHRKGRSGRTPGEGSKKRGRAREEEEGPPVRDLDPEEVAAFAHAIWGPPRLEPEAAEEPVLDGEGRLARAVEGILSSEAPEPAATRNGPEPAALAEPAPAPEPVEADQRATLEWLRSLLEEHGARSEEPAAADEPAGIEEPAAEEAAAEEPAAEEPAAARGPEPAAEEMKAAARRGDAEARSVREGTPAGRRAPEAKEPAEEEAVPAARGPRAAPTTGRPARGPRPSRPVLVGRSGPDPEADPEAEIPVVMPTGDAGLVVRIARRHGRRIAAGFLLLVVGGAAAIAISRRSAEPPPAPARARPAPASVASPAYRRLADAFESSLAAYRERSADFTLGRIDCAGLAAGLRALDQAFRGLSARATLEPTAASSFPGYRTEMRSARAHFEGTGCEAPSTTGAPRSGTESPD